MNVGKGPWMSGPPPSVGWWPASKCKDATELRWWDGEKWSISAYSHDDKNWAAGIAKVDDLRAYQPFIHWRDRADWWPERSRT